MGIAAHGAQPVPAHDGPQRVAGGAAIALVGGGVSFLLTTIYQIAVARGLGTAGFGLFVLALAVSSFLAEACDLGLEYGVLRFGAIAHGAGDPGRLRAVVRRALLGAFVAGSVASVLLVLGAEVVAGAFSKPKLAGVLVPLAVAVPFTSCSEIGRASLRAMGRVLPPVAADSVIAPAVRLTAGLAALSVAADPSHVAVGYAVTEVVVLAATLAMVWRVVPHQGQPGATTGLLRYSAPMSLNRLILYTNNQTEVFVLGLLEPAGPLGIFGIARRLSMLIGALLTSISVLFNPMVADLHNRERGGELDRLFKASTRWLFTLGLPLCLMALLFAPDVMRLFGKGFVPGAPALAILAVGQLVNVGTGTVAGVLAMIGRVKLSVLNALLFLGLSLALDVLLIPHWDLIGAAVASSTAVAAVNLLRLGQVRSILGILPYDRRFLRPVAAGVLSGALAWIIPYPRLDVLPRLMLEGFVLVLAYFGLLAMFGIDPVDREVAAALRARLRRRRSVEERNHVTSHG
jgi:O-antigen/teichoic acid export membrane protein